MWIAKVSKLPFCLTIVFCKSSRVKVEKKNQKRQAQTLYRLGILGTEFFYTHYNEGFFVSYVSYGLK